MKITDLIRQLKHEHKHVHRAAAETLGGIGPEAKEAAPALIQALQDSYVRYRAVEALKRIGTPEALEAVK